MDNNFWSVITTAITVLGGSAAWRFYEKRAMHKERDEDFIRHDCKDRISKLEALLEQSAKEKEEMRQKTLERLQDQEFQRYDMLMDKAFKENPNYPIVAALSNYRDLYNVPVRSRGEFIPKAGDIIHSSICVNFNVVKISYRNMFEEEGIVEPGDADFLKRLGSYMTEKNLKGYVTNEVSCYLDKTERA
jgi:hypothetical protein